jgi:hypothetical protein
MKADSTQPIATPVRMNHCLNCPHSAFEHEIAMNTPQSGRCLKCDCIMLDTPGREELGDEVEDLTQQVADLKARQRSDESQLCRVAHFTKRDARQAKGEPHDIATATIEYITDLQAEVARLREALEFVGDHLEGELGLLSADDYDIEYGTNETVIIAFNKVMEALQSGRRIQVWQD